MGFYNDHVLPHIVNLACGTKDFRPVRDEACEGLHGDVVEYQVVAVSKLASAAAGTTVDAAWLKAQRLVRRSGPIKLLAGGDLKVALTVKVDAASEAARKAVEAAGGKVETPNPKA